MFKDVKATVKKSLDDMNSVLEEIENVEGRLLYEEDPCFVELYQDLHRKILESHIEVASLLVSEIKRNKERRLYILDEMSRMSQELGLYDIREEEVDKYE